MKRILLSAAAAVLTSLAASAAAAPFTPAEARGHADYLQLEASAPAGAMRAASDIPGPFEPEGERVWYVKSSYCVAPILWFITDVEVHQRVADAYFAEDGTVYLGRTVNNFIGRDYYVKGTRQTTPSGEQVVFEFPQHMGTSGSGLPLDLYLVTVDGHDSDGWITGLTVAENQTYVMDFGADGSLTTAAGCEDILIGLCSYGEPIGYGDANYDLQVQTEAVLTPPAGLQTATAAFVNNNPEELVGSSGALIPTGGAGTYASLGFDGDSAWLTGWSTSMPGAWIKGEKTGAGIVFPSMQFLGAYYPEASEPVWEYAYAIKKTMGVVPDRDDFMGVEVLPSLTLSADGNHIWAGTDASWVKSTKQTVGNQFQTLTFAYTEQYDNPSLTVSDQLGKAATPGNPMIGGLNQWPMGGLGKPASNPLLMRVPVASEEEDLMTYCYCSIPQLDTDGLLMDPTQLYYEVFADGSLYTFTPEVYYGVPEGGMSLVPYQFSLASQNILSCWEILSPIHHIQVIEPVSESFGIRSVYLGGGERRESEIVTMAIGAGCQPAASEAPIAHTEWRNIDGTPADASSPGLKIRTDRLADGTVITSKFLTGNR